MTPRGPDVVDGSLSLSAGEWPAVVAAGISVTLAGTLSDSQFNNTNGTEPTQAVETAEYYIDTPPWITTPVPVPLPMVHQGGDVYDASLDTMGLSAGQHVIFVRGKDSDQNWGAFSAIFLGIGPPSEPDPPTGLTATATSHTSIDLAWSFVGPDPLGFNIERSPNGAAPWSLIASAGGSARTHTDGGLTASTTYYYRADAFNGVGPSGWSNTAMATTNDPPLPMVENLATADVSTNRGSIVSGSYQDTHMQNDVHEAIREQLLGGNPSKARSLASHTWSVDVVAGSSYLFTVDAYHTPNSEGDDFVLSYSLDGSNFTPMLTVTKTSPDDSEQTFPFTEDIAGTVYIRVEDEDRTRGNSILDTVYVDYFSIATATTGGDLFPPSPPSGLTAVAGNGMVNLDWADNGEADLDGYRVYRSTTDGGPYSELTGSPIPASSYPDSTALNGTTYYYVAPAVDMSGNESGYSSQVSATPAPGPTTVHVASIVTSHVGNGKRKARAVVTIVDNLGNLVDGASVFGTFSGGTYSESVAESTAPSGVATLTTTAEANGKPSFTFCVDDVQDSLAYVPAGNTITCKSQ
jgi:hypothetical protein